MGRARKSKGRLLAFGTLVLLVSVASASSAVAKSSAPAPFPEASKSRGCAAARPHRIGTRRFAYAAVARARTTVYRRPGGRALASFGRVNANGYPTVFGVVGIVRDSACAVTWYRVKVPRRPNGSTGYVHRRDVFISRVATRIEVDLSQHRLTLYRAGRRVLTTTVATGARSTPTPMGRFYVDQRLVPADPGGAYGPGALGVAAFSEVLTDWAQGGPIGIHGTNEPTSIGRSASNGCIRLRNAMLRRLFRITAAGSPVVIHP